MLRPTRLLLAGLALCLALTACQPLPRPFQPDDKRVSAAHLRALVANSLFIVEPLAGVPEEPGQAFATALADALQRKEVPATARHVSGDRPAAAIAATVTAQPPPGATGPLQIDYRMVAVDGGTREVARDELTVQADAFRAAEPALMASLAERGARRLMDTAFRGARPPQAPAPAPEAPKAAPTARFFVFDVSGAPGDGNAALARSMKRILTASGVPFAPEMTAEAYILAGSVAMKAAGQGQEQVTIDWTLFAPDGEEIGTVTVENLVPQGSLDGAWGPIADAASTGSAEGMIQLINAVLNSLPAAPQAAPAERQAEAPG
ncbi:hypothetical protein ACFOGJ_20420 [Marinibaculum pumilum]|uniref:Lipoprotein n=1 Tax=Marinibaculum pumilum TaxID=1766165 RepID=A0ABV7L4T5_9PROT